MSKKIVFPAEVKQELLDKYVKSGQTKTDFCNTNNIPISTFSRWCKESNLVRPYKKSKPSAKKSHKENKEDKENEIKQSTVEVNTQKTVSNTKVTPNNINKSILKVSRPKIVKSPIIARYTSSNITQHSKEVLLELGDKVKIHIPNDSVEQILPIVVKEIVSHSNF